MSKYSLNANTSSGVVGIKEYLNRSDWRVNANANQGYSLGGLILNTAGKSIAEYWLTEVYSQDIAEAHRNADIHIHDLDMLSGYCAGWSLRMLLEEGFNGSGMSIESSPPKHLSTALNQMVNFLGTLQNEWAGAQAFSSFDTYLAPFVHKYSQEIREKYAKLNVQHRNKEQYIQREVEKYVYDCLQSFVYNLNVPSRWGMQTPFTNITFDTVCPKDLQETSLILGGELYPIPFGKLEKEMRLIHTCFLKVMKEGDAKGRVFTFPIPTYNITKTFPWDDPDMELLYEVTSKYGLPYFQNFVSSDLDPHHIRSMCCRLQLDLHQLKKRGNGLFGSAEMTGSLGVVTLNLARIGYTYSQDRDGFFARCKELMLLAKESLERKRVVIQSHMDNGLYPYTKRYLGSLRNHFSTIGINGANEAVLNFSKGAYDISHKEGRQFVLDLLVFIRNLLTEFQEETGHMYNLEATPAEGTTYRFAKEDKKRFLDIIQSGTEEYPYYTNSSQLPVEQTRDIFEVLDHQDDLQRCYTGGTVLHLYLGESLSPHMCKRLIQKIFSNYSLPYITISPTFSLCPKHGYLQGEHDYCPKCDQDIQYHDTGEVLEERRKHTSLRKKHSIS